MIRMPVEMNEVSNSTERAKALQRSRPTSSPPHLTNRFHPQPSTRLVPSVPSVPLSHSSFPIHQRCNGTQPRVGTHPFSGVPPLGPTLVRFYFLPPAGGED